MFSDNYIAHLNRQNVRTTNSAGLDWMYFNHAAIPIKSMPTYSEISEDQAMLVIKKLGALLLRNNKKVSLGKTPWWHIVCRDYNQQELSKNTRSKISRGARRFETSKVSLTWLAENGYDCHVDSYKRYKNATPLSRVLFASNCIDYDKSGLFEAWGAFKDGGLFGYILVIREDDGLFTHTIDITPEGLKEYCAYAMFNTLLTHYVCNEKTVLCNGTRSISHETNMQDFLLSFNYQREYAIVQLFYRRDVKVVVNTLYPFRHLVRKLPFNNFFKNVASLLYQEELARQCVEIDCT